jgi:DNA-binding response OmpR family regulator
MTVMHTFRALVVEDDVLVRQATSRALTMEGFVCDVAADGMQALEKLQRRTFDIAVSDLRMPVLNGHKLVVEMLEMDSRPAIIVLTGLPEPKLVRDLFARGVEDVMAKPANYDILALKAKALAVRRRVLQQAAAQPGLVSDVEDVPTSGHSNGDSITENPSTHTDCNAAVVDLGEEQQLPPRAGHSESVSAEAFSIEELAAAIAPAIEADRTKGSRRHGNRSV